MLRRATPLSIAACATAGASRINTQVERFGDDIVAAEAQNI